MSARAPSATVSGPGVDRAMPDGVGPALSFAINCAVHSMEPGTWYVRDEAGDVAARVEKMAGGQTLIYGSAYIAAEREKEERAAFTPGA